jgi:hypothetical protein
MHWYQQAKCSHARSSSLQASIAREQNYRQTRMLKSVDLRIFQNLNSQFFPRHSLIMGFINRKKKRKKSYFNLKFKI